MEKLKAIVDEGMATLDGVISADQADKVAKALETAAIRGILEGQHRAVDACNAYSAVEPDMAHKIATAIRQKNDALIVNLSAMR